MTLEQASLFSALVDDQPIHLKAGYGYPGQHFDEMVDARGRPKPHWHTFLRAFNALGPAAHQRLFSDLDRSISESGMAFNVYADPDSGAARWQVDPIPVLFDPDSWDVLAQGLIQRARLIDAALQDLYGPRQLLRNRTLPPGAVFGNRDFLVHCADWPGRQRHQLFMYACDVGRTADGGWRVLADHIDVPSGNGTVLANRVALTQNLGNVFLDCGIRRLASHYARFQAVLDGLASDDGLIVMLSPGEHGADYFSHAYLARYLGLAMAEPGDLTVRDDRLFLKTLDGLRRVDLVLRKTSSRGLDPLYMVEGPAGGVPGIIEASRAQSVTFANALGAGMIDFRALAPWSRNLAEALLQEDLLIDDAPALWLGEADACERFIDERASWRLARLTSSAPVAPEILDYDEARLRSWLSREGSNFVALTDVGLGTTPRLEHDRLTSTPYTMRVFLTADEEGYTVLPGGLARCQRRLGTKPLAEGTVIKDVWVQARDPAGTDISLLSRQIKTAHLRRTGRELPSRAADDLFWLGRYAERAETTLRILRAVIGRLLDATRHDRDPKLLSRLLSLHLQGKIVDLGTDGHAYAWFHHAVVLLATDAKEPYGLRQSLEAMLRTASAARAHLSQDGWRVITALCTDGRWRELQQPRMIVPLARMVDDALRSLSALSGSAAENMTRNYAWRFLELGRRIERGLEASRIIGSLAAVRGAGEPASLRALLDLGDSFATYRSRYLMTPVLAPVLDLLILDETNPRSIAYQLVAIEEILDSLGRTGPYRSTEHRLVLALLTMIRMIDADQLARHRSADGDGELEELIDRCMADLQEASVLIARKHFVHAEPTISTMAMARFENDRPDA
ncbi:MAG: circularly permuted type 2 ATP-grasp protein [Pseudomonadota bacterium]